MTLDNEITFNGITWTIARILNNEAFLISKPIKTNAYNVLNKKIDSMLVQDIKECVIEKELLFNRFYVKPYHGVIDEWCLDAVFSAMNKDNKYKICLPGISDILPDMDIVYDRQNTNPFSRVSIFGTPSKILKYFSDNIKEIVLRDLVNINIGSTNYRPLRCYTSEMKSEIGKYGYRCFITDWDSPDLPQYYCDLYTERYMQLCCWLDIDKYEHTHC